ncbi:MAG: XRE family transcriptional regulator [Firmicutes bacterium]|nr:XRE family transcriptional regulator [Bacillota bacterium]
MLIRKDKLRELMKIYGNDSYNCFARALGVEAAQLHRILNNDNKGGAKFLGCLMRFCKTRGLNFEDYVTVPGEPGLAEGGCR